MVGTYPSSTPFNLAVPLLKQNMKVKKPDYNGGELSQQYPFLSGSNVCPRKSCKLNQDSYRVAVFFIGKRRVQWSFVEIFMTLGVCLGM